MVVQVGRHRTCSIKKISLTSKNIKMAKFTVEFDTLDELDDFYYESKKKFLKPEKKWPVFDEVDGDEFEMIMTEKGYLCRTSEAKKAICGRLGIRFTKRGSKLKYNRQDVLDAPNKKLRRRLRRIIRPKKVNFSARPMAQRLFQVATN